MSNYPYVSFEVEAAQNSTRKLAVWRPMVEIIVLFGNNYVSYPVIVDSGADFNIFHGGLLEALGGKLTKGRKRKIVGLGDQPLKGYKHKIELKLPGENKFITSAIFSNQIPEHAFGVLGQEGFFDKFEVCFDYNAKKMEIS